MARMTHGRRVALAVALLGPLMAVFFLSPAQAQIGRPPRFGGVPGTPGVPNIPTPPSIPGAPGNGMPGGPGFGGRIGPPQYDFKCSKCGKTVGTGTQIDKQQIAKCPHCGTTFNNTTSGQMEGMRERTNERMNRFGNRPGVPANPGGPNVPNGFGNNQPDQFDTEEQAIAPTIAEPNRTTAGQSSNTAAGNDLPTNWGKLGLIAGGVFLLILAAVVGLIVTIVALKQANKPRRKSRRRAARYEDD